jgi:hypothetical protein
MRSTNTIKGMRTIAVVGVGVVLLAACGSKTPKVRAGSPDVSATLSGIQATASSIEATASASASVAASLLAKEACSRFQQLYADIQTGKISADQDVLAGVVEVENLARQAGASKVADIAQRMQDDINSSNLTDLQKASADLTVECAKEGAPLSPVPSSS